MVTKINFPTRQLRQLVTLLNKSYLPGNTLNSAPSMGHPLHLLMTVNCYDSLRVPKHPAYFSSISLLVLLF